MSIRILVADDHGIVRAGLARLLADADMEIVAEAESGRQAIELAKEHQPDVILLDIRMPDMNGLEALEQIREALPNVKVVILSTYDNPTYIARAIASGASDYVLKGASQDDILAAVRGAVGGEGPSHAGELRKVAGLMQCNVPAGSNDVLLSARELQVLRHVALGLSNKEIAHSLTICINTVKEHVQQIVRKAAVADRTEAAVWAIKTGLV